MEINKKTAFYTYHPLVNFLYFTFILAFSMIFMNPICLGISLLSAFVYSIHLKGKKAVIFNFLFLLPMLLLTAIMNPLFNHEGITILCYFQNGKALTLESVIYGIGAASLMACVICWFSCYNEIMSSDKFVYLFGRIIPALSLIFSMVLRFVPKFKTQIKVVTNAQKCIGQDMFTGSVFKRAKCGINIISIMITWAFENAIDTADSMKSRGYGLKGRTAFSIYRFDKRDKIALFFIVLLGVFVIIGGALGALKFSYFPSLGEISLNFFSICIFIAYFFLAFIPIIIDVKETYKWNVIQSKI